MSHADADAAGEDDVLGAIDGVGDADGAGEGAQRGFEATESFEGGGDVAVFFYQGGGAHVTFERTCATVGADGGVAFNGDIHLPDVAGGVAIDMEGFVVIEYGRAD